MLENPIVDDKNPYRTLGLRKWATDQEVKHAYIRMVKKFNPEIYPDQFIIIRKAYDLLRTPERRAQVDIHLFNELPGAIGYKEVEKGTDSLVKLNRQIRKIEEAAEGRELAGQEEELLLNLRRQRSLVYADKNMWREAMAEWVEIYKRDKTDRQSRRNLVLAHSRIAYHHAVSERFRDAVGHWEEILKRHPASVEILHNLGIAYSRLGDKEREKDYWQRILQGWNAKLKKEPDNNYLKALIVETHKHFGGQFLSDQGKVALQIPRERDEGEPMAMGDDEGPPPAEPRREPVPVPIADSGSSKVFDSFSANKELGLACMDKQNWDGAISALEKCLKEKPEDIEILNNLGWAYLNSGSVDRAFLMWNKALRYDPKNKETRDNICRGHMKVGKSLQKERVWVHALVHFKSILQMQPDNPQVHVEIGNTYMLKGDPDSAVENWQRALKLDPKNRNVRNAIRKAKQMMR